MSLFYETLAEAAIDSLKLFPFLLVTYLLLEYIEKKIGNKTVNLIGKSGKVGPLVGALCGVFPQCGLAAAASNFYAARVISVGTLMAVYLSTSDEMLPIMISSDVSTIFIIEILLLKVVVAVFVGMIIDLLSRKISFLRPHDVDVMTLCRNEHCKCEEGIVISALRHSVKITIFVFIISWLFNILIGYLGKEPFAEFMSYPLAGPIVGGLIGLIPNCSASVIVTQLFLEDAISFGTMFAGLLSGAGVGLLVLCRVNPRIKENLAIATILYLSGVIIGTILDFCY